MLFNPNKENCEIAVVAQASAKPIKDQVPTLIGLSF